MRALNRSIWPYRVTIDSDIKKVIHPMEKWLLDEVGQITQVWTVVYLYNHTHFYFRQSEHATHFTLRWL